MVLNTVRTLARARLCRSAEVIATVSWRGRRIDRTHPTTQATTECRGIASSALALATLVALVVVALVAFQAPGQAGAKKHRHKAKRQRSELIASDTSADPKADNFWGRSYCAKDQQVQQFTTGGDPHQTATGDPQGDSAFRRVTVFDGDDAFGERCEIGWNSVKSPTAWYRPGHHLITELSVRLPSNFPLGVYTWQAVLQMAQSGPSTNSGGTPMFELDAWGGRWRLRQSLSRTATSNARELWSAPARLNFWTRFVFDVRYSANEKHGYIRVGADLNGDGDMADPGELSRGFRTYTLKIDAPPGSKAGKPIPSHLDAGIYHDESIPCPSPSGCSVDLDNVQVLRP